MAVIDEVLSILANSKNLLELPTATGEPGPTDWVGFWNVTAGRYEKIQVQNLVSIGDWRWIEGSWVVKTAPNTNLTTLEANDVVWFKPITNGATFNEVLVGFTYDGGDKDLNASYTQNNTITT